MSTKNLSAKIEKELARTTESYESLISTMREYIQTTMNTITKKMEECGDMLETETKTKTRTKATKAKSAKAKTPKKQNADGITNAKRGGLLNHLLDILKNSEKPLTEADIAKILLSDPEKYNWKSKSETTLYQTLRRAVKEQKIAESGDRSKETKTYHVA
jgi:hypothetical protein